MLNWSLKSHGAGGAGKPAENEPVALPPPKPKIALALGGGAARGWAHIGVLKALDEAGIEIGMVAGTSIGALAGGCYLAGKLAELEEFARSLTMRRIASLLDLTIGGGGLLGGMRLTKRMQEHLEGMTIEDLPKPFVAVASELKSGHEVWIDGGSLITALRASYALPGIFEPIRSNGRTLVDGALVNPVPVSVCRSYEQPLVVAVNLNYDVFGRSAVVKHKVGEALHEGSSLLRDKLGLTSVMVQSFNIIQDRISRARLAGDPPDLALHPRVNDIGLSEFHRAEETIARGYEETMARISEIRRMQEAFTR
ncbi:patatin-like phospholipase family protein [Rhizobium paknamense]|uniref:NTE family protein n=1 Tax=Rhizobium paknamense TaxID=1206817 RepID=A0ABU0ICL4_9HYPH|nr:patatin-like phospholipase family protein [Rhizobium paknamense]MDQ0455984.1 NTE family protein [Rhizobium paknamense]